MSNNKLDDYEYDVALSFAGEERDYVRQVAKIASERGIKVFYDEEAQIEMWGNSLIDYLNDIFEKRARYCVMFISEKYLEKPWTSFERDIIQKRNLIEKGVLLPARFDDTKIPGLGSKFYIDLRSLSPEKFVDLLEKKIKGVKNDKNVKKEFRVPKLSQSIDPYQSKKDFIAYIISSFQERNNSVDDLKIHADDVGNKVIIRVLHGGKITYSLDIYKDSAFTGDSGISFYGIPGEISSSGGSSNAWGEFKWSKDKNSVVLELHDMSMLGTTFNEDREYAYEEFMDALWNKIIDEVESDY